MRQALDVFYRSIFDTYKHLGTIVWATLCWMVAVLPLFTAGPATAALFRIIQEKQEGKSPDLKDFWRYFQQYFKPGMQLSALYAALFVPGVLYLSFMLQTPSFIWLFIGTLAGYVMLLWHLVITFAFPLLVKESEAPLRATLLRSLRLVSENLWFSANITLYAILLLLLSTIFTIALLAAAGMISLFLLNASWFLMQKYDSESAMFDTEVSWKGTLRPWKV
ncbi:YesL family protein [Alkalicoccus daliensis]|uniref:Uncharacterized membrane protein YesL n=1 Tax=Alkalicoccus daliensis TaxID=745820 RepID=A0A1H0F3X9_9BACI|nr:YesL family protein [Alkalicoccus daliensis]SDN89342.1 Uncharacterized membrane protein YesL [Alkalicoccus daliensis]